jgi:predicted RNA-binding Zn-ribbon protein involved in translation (DUF1610 family)
VETLACVSTGVEIDLQSTMPTRSRMLRAKRVEVLHDEFLLEGRYGVLQERCPRCGEHNVINIKQQIYRIGTTAEDEQGGVGHGLNKS